MANFHIDILNTQENKYNLKIIETSVIIDDPRFGVLFEGNVDATINDGIVTIRNREQVLSQIPDVVRKHFINAFNLKIQQHRESL